MKIKKKEAGMARLINNLVEDKIHKNNRLKFCYKMNCQKDENKEKGGRDGPFFKKSSGI